MLHYEYECLNRMEDVRRDLNLIIVEGYDERNGFSKEAYQMIEHSKIVLEEVLRLIAKNQSSALYGSIVNNTEI